MTKQRTQKFIKFIVFWLQKYKTSDLESDLIDHHGSEINFLSILESVQLAKYLVV